MSVISEAGLAMCIGRGYVQTWPCAWDSPYACDVLNLWVRAGGDARAVRDMWVRLEWEPGQVICRLGWHDHVRQSSTILVGDPGVGYEVTRAAQLCAVQQAVEGLFADITMAERETG